MGGELPDFENINQNTTNNIEALAASQGITLTVSGNDTNMIEELADELGIAVLVSGNDDNVLEEIESVLEG